MAEPKKQIEPLDLTSPIFITAAIAAAFADVIMGASLSLGVILVPLMVGIPLFLFGFMIREVIAAALFGYVLVKMKSPRSLLGDIATAIPAPEIGILLLIFRPWVIMLIAFITPLPILTAALFLAAIAQNTLINKIIDAAQAIGNPTKLFSGGVKATGVKAGKTALQQDIKEEAGQAAVALESEVATRVRNTTEHSLRRGVIQTEREEGNALEKARRKPRFERDEEGEEEASKDAFPSFEADKNAESDALEERLNTGIAELHRIKGSLEELPFDENDLEQKEEEDDESLEETINLKKAA